MRIWDALRASVGRGAWVSFTEPGGYQRAIRYDAKADLWWARTKDRGEGAWSGPSGYKVAPIALNGYTVSTEWEIVEVHNERA